MIAFLVILLAFQDQGIKESDGVIQFQSISAGNRITQGPFSFNVPDNTLFAAEEFAPLMYSLLHVDNIPFCSGVFTSDDSNWDWAIAVQYVSSPIVLKPALPDEIWARYIASHNLLDGMPTTIPGTILLPPVLDSETATFSIGANYVGDVDIIVKKKVWTHPEGGLILSLYSKNKAYEIDGETIESVFQSIVVSIPESAELNGQPTSYLTALGVPVEVLKELSQAPASAAPPVEQEPAPVNWSLLAGGLFVLVLVLVITRTRRKD